jgi:hypothetical protein
VAVASLLEKLTRPWFPGSASDAERALRGSRAAKSAAAHHARNAYTYLTITISYTLFQIQHFTAISPQITVVFAH